MKKFKIFMLNAWIKIKNLFIKIGLWLYKYIKLIYRYITKENKTKKDKIILYLLGLILLLVIILFILLGIFSHKDDSYDTIKKSFKKILSYDEYNLDSTIDFYNYEASNELTNKTKVDLNIIKKKDNINVELLSCDDNDTYSLGHMFINDDRVEFILGDDSYYARYKDIFQIVTNYLPSLGELSHDLSTLSYNKYKDVIIKDIKDYFKNNKKGKADDLLKSFVNDSYHDEELSSTYIDGTKYDLKRYYIKKNARDMIKLELDMLKNIKDERKVRTLVRDINLDLLDTAKKLKDYEKVRMTSDEYNTFSYTYSNELVNMYDKNLDDRIDKLEILYSMLSKDDEVEIALYLTKNNEVKQIYIFYPLLMDNKIVYIKSTTILSDINNIKSKDVVPKNNNRIDVSKASRSDLYLIVDKLINKYNALKEKYDINFKEIAIQ